MLPDLTPLFWLAWIGVIASVLSVIGLVSFAIWFLVNHVQFV